MTPEELQLHNAKHQYHPMTHPKASQTTPPHIITAGEGVYVTDIAGNRLVDGVGGLWNVNLGYSRREIKEAISQQLDELVYYSGFAGTANPRSIELSAKLMALSHAEDMARVLFSSGGSDAIETALKLTRQYWRAAGQPTRTKFISLKEGYHGTHVGGASVNGNARFRQGYEPLLPGCFQIDTPWLYRNPYTDDPETLGFICAELLEREIMAQGPNTVAAFIAEPVQGAGGVIVPPDNFWPLVREVCDRYEVLLIADEVVTGFGRIGSMFGARAWGVKPDMMCLAKGITSGYIPLGATMLNTRVAEAIESSDDKTGAIMHGYTYTGHPVACAAALAALTIVEEEDIPAQARQTGEYFQASLQELGARHQLIGDVRGKGLMAGIELVADPESKKPLDRALNIPGRLAEITMREGAIVRPSGTGMIILSPPLIIARHEIDIIIGALDTALREISD